MSNNNITGINQKRKSQAQIAVERSDIMCYIKEHPPSVDMVTISRHFRFALPVVMGHVGVLMREDIVKWGEEP